MTSKKTLYLANPYGFPLQQRAGPLKEIVADLEALGAEVWEPVARNNQIDRARPGWAYEIGQADLRDVRRAEGLFAVVNGCPPDEGVLVELGMAIAWAKPVFLFRDDFRRCIDSEIDLPPQPDVVHGAAGDCRGVSESGRDRRTATGGLG